jgi:hypothetical protein
MGGAWEDNAMDPWDDKMFGENGTDDLEIFEGIEDIIGSVLSFLVFASAISWISEKLKQLFKLDEPFCASPPLLPISAQSLPAISLAGSFWIIFDQELPISRTGSCDESRS